MKSKTKIKCVVWDLDNTLWNGILSENDNPQVSDTVREVIETLDKRGILQSISSKNDHKDAMSHLESFGLADYFLYPQISWGMKSDALGTIREKLNIGMDSIAFVDDQPFERDEVNSLHPEVQCFDALEINQLLDNEVFQPRFITSESADRRAMYQRDVSRNQEEEKLGNNNQFLKGLQLKFSIAHATEEDLQRVEELTVRTNQLNATGFTYSYDELLAFMHSPKHQLLVCGLVDKYGSYGKIGVALLEEKTDGRYLQLLLMSCRVMSRGVGSVLLNYIINITHEDGKNLYAPFSHTDRNRIMYITYKFAGFEAVKSLGDNAEVLQYSGNGKAVYPDFIDLNLPETTPSN